jgi:hypothetical protein
MTLKEQLALTTEELDAIKFKHNAKMLVCSHEEAIAQAQLDKCLALFSPAQLTELERGGKVEVSTVDQTTPKNPWVVPSFETEVTKKHSAYKDSQEDMREAGFKRVVKHD